MSGFNVKGTRTQHEVAAQSESSAKDLSRCVSCQAIKPGRSRSHPEGWNLFYKNKCACFVLVCTPLSDFECLNAAEPGHFQALLLTLSQPLRIWNSCLTQCCAEPNYMMCCYKPRKPVEGLHMGSSAERLGAFGFCLG